MNISIIPKEVTRWAEVFLFLLALAVATASSLPSVLAAEDEVTYLQPTRRQLSDFYASNHQALMRDDEQPSEEPDVASIINGTATGGPLSYQVGLTAGIGYFPPTACGGSLIAPRVVLTAAHCPTSLNKVLINAYNLSSFDNGIPNGGGIVQASSYVIHPDYEFPENDIALWFLPFPIAEDEHFKFATLNEDPNVPADNETLFVSGWGRTVNGVPSSKSPILLGTNVDYVTTKTCLKDYGGDPERNPPFNTDGMMCAAAADRTGTCLGDSGGPLMIANGTQPAMDPPIQVGIVSWEEGGCANPNFPTVYTRVSSYVDWIRSTACQKVGELCPSSSKSSKSKSSKSKNDRP